MTDLGTDGENSCRSPLTESPATESATSGLVGPLDADKDFWQCGSLLLVRRGTRMPDRCVVCNVAADPIQLHCVVRKKLPTWLILVLIFMLGPFFLIGVAMCQPTAQLWPGLCSRHRKREIRGRRTTIGLLVLGFSLPVMPFFLFTGPPSAMGIWVVWCLIAGVLTLFATILFNAFRPRPLRANKIDDDFIWLEDIPADYVVAFSQAAAEA